MKTQETGNESSKYEIEKWERYYLEALRGEGQEAEDLFFFQYSERDGKNIIRKRMNNVLRRSDLHMAELACGASRVSLSLAEDTKIGKLTLFDGSAAALDYARSITPRHIFNKVSFVKGNLFETNLEDNSADIVWNSGVIEHYQKSDMKRIIKEMFRIASAGGYVIVAIPNRNSLATMKARILGQSPLSKYLTWVPGYRNDTEIPYSNQAIASVIRETVNVDPVIEYAGSPLWASASPAFLKATGAVGKRVGCSFMSYFIVPKVSSVEADVNAKSRRLAM